MYPTYVSYAEKGYVYFGEHETGDIIKGIVQQSHPKCVIAIDALVARSITRLGKSIQLSDSGINTVIIKEKIGMPVMIWR